MKLKPSLFLLCSMAVIFGTRAQSHYTTKDTSWNGGYLSRISYVPGYSGQTNCFVIMHGAGEVSSTTNNSQVYGPHYWLNHGWDGSVVMGNGTHYPVYVTLQQQSHFTRPWVLKPILDSIISRFNVAPNGLHLIALSEGGWVMNEFITYQPSASDESYMDYASTMVNIQGQEPADTYGSTIGYPQRYGHAAKAHGLKYLGFEQTLDNRNIWKITENINDSIAGSAFFFWTTFGNSGHGSFNDFYDPSQNNWTLSNPDVNASNGSHSTVPMDSAQNVYQWSLRAGGDTTNDYVVSSGNQSPTADAGTDQTITLPTNSVTLNGSGTDADGTISSYSWTYQSGPSTYTIASPSSATTNITGLVQGTYVFRLTVTDNDGAIGYDDIQIIVNSPPTANAGTDQTITLPTNQATLSGSGSDADGSISSYSWAQVSGPNSAGISSPSTASTTVTGLGQGNYVFRLTVTDNDGGTGYDDVQITVNAASGGGGSGDTINVNVYGGTNPYSNAAWNNWNVSSSLTSTSFTYSNGSSSTVWGRLTGSAGIGDNGSGYDGTMCPPEVLRYSSYSTSRRNLTIKNLDSTATYDFEIYASRNNTNNYHSLFSIGTDTVNIKTDTNHVVKASFLNVVPTGDSIVVWFDRPTGTSGFTYLNGFSILKHGSESAPIVNAGSDTSIYMPKTSVQLNASIEGTARTIQWTKLSGGAHPQEGVISNADSLNPVISNIGVGDYVYELYVSNGSANDRDTVTIHGLQQRSRTPNPNYEKFTLTPTNGDIYFTNIMSSYPTLNGGDTLVIGSDVTGVVQLYGDDGSGGWGGDSLNPVVVINPPGQQIIIGGAFRINGQYVKVTGSGDPGIRYGFKLTGTATSGFALPAKHSNVEIERCYVYKGAVGIYAKSQIDSNDVLTYHPNWYFKNDWFHDNLLDSTEGESMYIGHTFTFDLGQPTSGYIPVKHDGLIIERDSVRWAGWDGIQTSNALNTTIRNNYVYETGRNLKPSQLFGIILGGYTTGRVDSNEVHLARSSGIAIFGYDSVKVRGNKLDSCGYADIQIEGNANSGNPFTSIYLNDNQIGFIGVPSPPLAVIAEDNCIQKVSAYTGGAALKNANGNGTTAPGFIENNTIGDTQNRSVSSLIVSNVSGETISGNSLGSCSGPLVINVNVYGGTNAYGNSEWNNWNVSSVLTSDTLKYSDGSFSGVVARLTGSAGIGDNGASYGGTMCPDTVLRYASYSTSYRTLTLKNLNPSSSYDLEFYASRANSGNSTYFKIGTTYDTVTTDNNKIITGNFYNVAPAGDSIIIYFDRTSSSTWNYLNGFKITEHDGQGSIAHKDKREELKATMERSFHIYPNPAVNQLFVRYSGEEKGSVQLKIYDEMGRLVQQRRFEKTQTLFAQQLDINSLGRGVYFIEMIGPGKTIKDKFIKP